MSVSLQPSKIDPDTGIVQLTLVPFYLERLHGALQPQGTNGIDLPPGMPFPLLHHADPIIVQLYGGMSIEQIGHEFGFENGGSDGKREWWRWAAYAFMPFGWSEFPTPQFHSGRLTSLALQRFGADEDENFDEITQSFTEQLGEPTSSKLTPAGCWPFRAPNKASRRLTEWTFKWGSVYVWYEYRDYTAETVITWSFKDRG